MTKQKICKRCGAVLDGEVEEVLPDGTEQGRCSRCSRPYVVKEGKASMPVSKSEPEPEAKLGPEPEVEPEPEPEAKPGPEPEVEPEPGDE